jgi:hypothetical protein
MFWEVLIVRQKCGAIAAVLKIDREEQLSNFEQ